MAFEGAAGCSRWLARYLSLDHFLTLTIPTLFRLWPRMDYERPWNGLL